MNADHTLKRGNRLPPLVIVATDNIGPVDLEGATATVRMVNVLTGANKIADASAEIGSQPTFTTDPTTNTLNSPGHGLNNGEQVTLKSTGQLPGALSIQTLYYVINALADSLQLALALNGSPVDITSAGSGTHSLLPGRITYEWQTADVDTPGTYLAQVDTVVGGKTLTYPNNRQLKIEIISDLSDTSDRTKAIVAVMNAVQVIAEP